MRDAQAGRGFINTFRPGGGRNNKCQFRQLDIRPAGTAIQRISHKTLGQRADGAAFSRPLTRKPGMGGR